MSSKITFIDYTTRKPFPLDNPTKDNALEQATVISATNPDIIFLLSILSTEDDKNTIEEWRLRAGVVIFHIIIPPIASSKAF